MNLRGSRAGGPAVASMLYLVIAIALIPLGVTAQSPERSSMPIYLPLLSRSFPTSTPARTPTSTPSPTLTLTPTTTPTLTVAPSPTGTTCPQDNVTGTYAVDSSNLQHDCPVEPPVMLSGELAVVQQGSQLLVDPEGEEIVGTIDENTGEFEIRTTVSAFPFTLDYTLVGAFHLGQSPMTFDAVGTANISSIIGSECTATAVVTGERVSCEGPPPQTQP